MKNRVFVKNDDKTIVMDRTFAKLAENARSEEYRLLQEIRRDYPTYIVVRKTIKKAAGKERYTGLTYDYMRTYIRAHSDEASAEVMLNQLEYKIEISHCHSPAYRYPTIKKWFLDTYPEVKEHGIEPKERDTITTVADKVA